MARDLTPTVPPGWRLRVEGEDLTLAEFALRFFGGRQPALWIIDPLGDAHGLMIDPADRDALLADQSLAKIIACGIHPWGGADNWTMASLEAAWLKLMPVRRALVAPRPDANDQLRERAAMAERAIGRAVEAASVASDLLIQCCHTTRIVTLRDTSNMEMSVMALRDAQEMLALPLVGVERAA